MTISNPKFDFAFLALSKWWPLIVVLFYTLALVPTIFTRRYTQDSGSAACQEVAIFVTMGFVISAFALPIVLARTGVVSDG